MYPSRRSFRRKSRPSASRGKLIAKQCPPRDEHPEHGNSDHRHKTMATATMTMPPQGNLQAAHGENSTKNGMANRPHPSVYLTIDGLIRSHAAEDADIPTIGYPAQGVSDYEIHTAKVVDRYVDAACWWYQKQGLQPAVSDTTMFLSWHLTFLGPVGRKGTCHCTAHAIMLGGYNIILCAEQTRLGSALPIHETYGTSICQPHEVG